MDLAALEIFRAVALEGSVTRAAERLGRVQSNVTTRVQQLEEQLGATLFLREGKRMVLTPAGGALGTMLLPFKLGVGGRLGSGRQYVSWIDLDDVTGLIYHALVTKAVKGPLNLTAPHPVSNGTFTDTLGRILGRPTLIPVPRLGVEALFGEMGKALLLDGARVVPEKAEATGFVFRYPTLEESLRFQLGKPDESHRQPQEEV